MSDLGEYAVDQIVLDDNLNVLPKLPEGCIGLTVCSPPYFNWRPEYAQWDSYAAYSGTVGRWFRELYRVTRPGRRLVWNVCVIANPGGYDCGFLPIPHGRVFMVFVL